MAIPSYVTIVKNKFLRTIDVNKFGASFTNTTSWQTLSTIGGIVTLDPNFTPYTPQIASTEVADVGITVEIEGLDAQGYIQEEELTLNGQTPVTATKQFTRVLRAYITGTTEPTGDIWVGSGTFTAGVPTVKYTHILFDNNQTLQAFFTIPKGFKGKMISYWVGTGQGKETEFRLKIRKPGGVPLVKNYGAVYESHYEFIYGDITEEYPELTDMWIEIKPASINTTVVGGGMMKLIETEEGSSKP